MQSQNGCHNRWDIRKILMFFDIIIDNVERVFKHRALQILDSADYKEIIYADMVNFLIHIHWEGDRGCHNPPVAF